MEAAMSQEEWYSRYNCGEDPYSICADDLRRRGYLFNGARWVSPDDLAVYPSWLRGSDLYRVEQLVEEGAAASGKPLVEVRAEAAQLLYTDADRFNDATRELAEALSGASFLVVSNTAMRLIRFSAWLERLARRWTR